MKINKEIEFKTLHSNKHRIYLLCGIVCVVVLMVTLVITTSKAKYKTTQSLPLINGTINYAPYDYKTVAMYVDGEPVDTLPEGKYELTSESYCTNEDNAKDESITLSYDTDTQGLLITPMNKKGTKCYLYFEEQPLPANSYILVQEGGTEAIQAKGTPDFSKTAITDEGMYAAEDDYGTSYYYRVGT